MLWSAPEAAELIAQGNLHDQRYEPEAALKSYLPAEQLDPGNARLMVLIARQYSHLMTDAKDETAKRELGEKALVYAQKAVKLDPKLCDAHLSIAVCHGKLLPFKNNREKLEGSRQVKAAAEKAVALEPSNDLAWHMLGRWHMELSTISGVKKALAQVIYGSLPAASQEEAARCLEKAVALNPNRLMNHIELGRTYALMNRDEEAKKLIAKGLAMPSREKDDPDTKERGRETLRNLGS